MKKEFVEPEVELLRLTMMDVITTSGDLEEDELPWVPMP